MSYHKPLRNKDGLNEKEYLAQYHPGDWPKPSVTADIAIVADCGNEQYEILLVKRGNHPYLGYWALPGGFANPDENLLGTATRELEEETGVTGVMLTSVDTFSTPGRDPRDWTVTQLFTARVEKENVRVHAGDDAAEAKWFRINTAGEGDAATLSLMSNDLTLGIIPDAKDVAFDHAEMIPAALRKLGIMK